MNTTLQHDSQSLKVAGIILLRPDGAALLQLRDNKPGLSAAGLWVFPGGHCDPGESIEACARREFAEETAYQCRELHWLTTFLYRSEDTQKDYELTFFWSLYDGVQTVSCLEGQKVCFMPIELIDPRSMPAYMPAVWQAAIRADRERKEGFAKC